MKSVGFKEWSLVCDALGRGEQTVILRHGGLAEGRAGFTFQHAEFFLFPTFFHEQIGKVRGRARSLPAGDGTVRIGLSAQVERVVECRSLAAVEALEPFHILTADVVRERFHYQAPGLLAAFVRAFALEPVWSFPEEKRFGGCRSWVDLPPVPSLKSRAVLSESAFREKLTQFDRLTDREEFVPLPGADGLGRDAVTFH